VRWRIPFFHHPPFCAGPQHHNSRSIIEGLIPRFRAAGVRAVFCGHEHNFQHSRQDGIDYFVTGAAGKVRGRSPTRFEEAGTISWASAGHFLIVKVAGNSLTVMALDETGAELARLTPGNARAAEPMVVAN
jgi:hypothetical protein